MVIIKLMLGNRTPLKIMKNDNKIIILAIAIILSAIIVAYAIMNKPVSSLDDCYDKVYKEYKGEGYDDAGAALIARKYCLKGVSF